jgi:uncharacterized surface protein with fasciclin (FAS1) repeats
MKGWQAAANARRAAADAGAAKISQNLFRVSRSISGRSCRVLRMESQSKHPNILTNMKKLILLSAALIAAPLAVMAGAEKKEAKQPTIVGIAADNKDFSTLVAAVKAAGLVETLSGSGPFTVFAPTNAAFEKLPKGTVEELLKPENKEKLVKVLTYHVVSGKVMAADVKTGKVKTVQGGELDVKVADGAVTVDGAKVVKTDIVGSNGVIHVIDAVVLPK